MQPKEEEVEEISLEEFIRRYEPIPCERCRPETEGINVYINYVDTLHQLRLEPAYTAHVWTEIDKSYLVNGKSYAGATGIIICKNTHDVEMKIKVKI